MGQASSPGTIAVAPTSSGYVKWEDFAQDWLRLDSIPTLNRVGLGSASQEREPSPNIAARPRALRAEYAAVHSLSLIHI